MTTGRINQVTITLGSPHAHTHTHYAFVTRMCIYICARPSRRCEKSRTTECTHLFSQRSCLFPQVESTSFSFPKCVQEQFQTLGAPPQVKPPSEPFYSCPFPPVFALLWRKCQLSHDSLPLPPFGLREYRCDLASLAYLKTTHNKSYVVGAPNMGHQPQLDCVGADLRMFLCFPQVQPSASTFTSFSSATLLNNKTELARHFGKECEKRSSLFFSLLFPKSCLASRCTLGELSCVQHPASSVGQKRHRSFGYLSEPALLGQDKTTEAFLSLNLSRSSRLPERKPVCFYYSRLFADFMLVLAFASSFACNPHKLSRIHSFLILDIAMCGPCGLPPTPLDPLTPPPLAQASHKQVFFS